MAGVGQRRDATRPGRRAEAGRGWSSGRPFRSHLAKQGVKAFLLKVPVVRKRTGSPSYRIVSIEMQSVRLYSLSGRASYRINNNNPNQIHVKHAFGLRLSLNPEYAAEASDPQPPAAPENP